MATDNENTKLLNELRNLTSEKRKELLDKLDKEELAEKEALEKNPNLPLERQMQNVLNELNDLKILVNDRTKYCANTQSQDMDKQCTLKKNVCNMLNLNELLNTKQTHHLAVNDEQNDDESCCFDFTLLLSDFIPWICFCVIMLCVLSYKQH